MLLSEAKNMSDRLSQDYVIKLTPSYSSSNDESIAGYTVFLCPSYD